MTTTDETYSPEGLHETRKSFRVSSISVKGAPPDLRATVEWADGNMNISWDKSESLKMCQQDSDKMKSIIREVRRAVRTHAEGCYEKKKHQLARCFCSQK